MTTGNQSEQGPRPFEQHDQTPGQPQQGGAGDDPPQVEQAEQVWQHRQWAISFPRRRQDGSGRGPAPKQ